jgi:hypothetical protein
LKCYSTEEGHLTHRTKNQLKNGRPTHCHCRLLYEARDKEIFGFLGTETLDGPRSAPASYISICYEHIHRSCPPPFSFGLSFIRMAVVRRFFKQRYLSHGHISEFPHSHPNNRNDQRIYPHNALPMRLSRTSRTR